MVFSDVVGAMDDTILDTYGTLVTFQPQDGVSSPSTVKAVIQDGQLMEAVMPGVNLVLFVRQALLTPDPKQGDHFTISSRIYKVHTVKTDEGGGILLGLKFHRKVI